MAFRVARPDPWTSRHEYDKLLHGVGGGWLFAVLNYIWPSYAFDCLVYTCLAGFLWEIKDGFIKWEEHGAIGGDGFSWKDLVATVAGAYLTYRVMLWSG